jgi:hypothetical protein
MLITTNKNFSCDNFVVVKKYICINNLELKLQSIDNCVLSKNVFVQPYAKRAFRVSKTGREIQFHGRCSLRQSLK